MFNTNTTIIFDYQRYRVLLRTTVERYLLAAG